MPFLLKWHELWEKIILTTNFVTENISMTLLDDVEHTEFRDFVSFTIFIPIKNYL
jgi:hypothetical protein